MIITAETYWTDILKNSLEQTHILPSIGIGLITQNKKLQQYINEEVIEEFFSDETNITELLQEILWNIDKKYITQSLNTNEIENIIKQCYKVTYINDDFIEVEEIK